MTAKKTYYCVTTRRAGKTHYYSCSTDENKAYAHLSQLRLKTGQKLQISTRTTKPWGVKAPPRGKGPTQGSLFSKDKPGGRQGSLFGPRRPNAKDLRVQIRRDGNAVFAKVGGKIGKIKLRGESLAFHPSFEYLSPGMMTRLTHGRIHRDDGTGRRIPEATRRAMEDAIEAALVEAGAKRRDW